ncbi:MAG: NusG domain II-containing protein [Treponema sp.]|nr:NusG domain II-containing protein [Treponema sp.]
MSGMVARRLRVMDFVFAAAVAGVIVFLFLRLGRNLDDSKKRLLVQSSAGGEYVFPLDRDGLYNVPGLHGDSVIEVLDGKARFKDSPCPNKTCVQQGFVSLPGEWAACLPNDVFIMIQGAAKKGSVDAVAN